MNYTEVVFYDLPAEKRELLIALLGEQDFEGFEEAENNLKAYIAADLLNRNAVEEVARQLNARFDFQELPDTNYNALWEANFDPVVVDNFCAIRAPFHSSINQTRYELIITPKMSFGTGHHATTYMMISRMQHLNVAGKNVLDFGTGTGVLAILSSFLGAQKIVAVDCDDWSIANANENFQINHTPSIQLVKKDSAAKLGNFDIILANVTRNVITDNFTFFVDQLNIGGFLLLSGLLEEDDDHIQMLASQHGLAFNGKSSKDKWICMEFAKH